MKISNADAMKIENTDDIKISESVEFFNGDAMHEILRKVVEELRRAFDENGIRRKDMESLYGNINGLPIGQSTWDNYKKFVSKTSNFNEIRNMKLDIFYNICVYTNTDADYFLGFRSKPKEIIGKTAQEDYGLSIEALRHLDIIRHRLKLPLSFPARYKDFAESKFIEVLITNFASGFLESTLIYFYALDNLEEFNEIYMDSNGQLKKEYLVEETRWIDELKVLEDKVDLAKFKISQTVERFLDRLRQELLKDNEENKDEDDKKTR